MLWLAVETALLRFWAVCRQLGDWPTNSRMAVNDWWHTRFSADQGLRKGRPIWATWATKEGTLLAA
jgi:hypothetical protein